MPGSLLDTLTTLVWCAVGGAVGYALAPLVGLVRPYDPEPDDDAPPPRPACPHCDTAVPWARLLPLPARLLVARRCPHCDTAIGGASTAVVTTATAATFALLAARFGAGAELLAFSGFAAVGVVLAVVDARTCRLPNPLVLPSYPFALLLLAAATVAAALGGAADGTALDDAFRDASAPLLTALVGLVGAWGFYFLLWLIYPAGMGWGDVKLSGVLGLYLGWLGLPYVVAGVFAAFLGSSLVGLVLIAARLATRRTQMPHGPFMLAAALLVVVAGDALPMLGG